MRIRNRIPLPEDYNEIVLSIEPERISTASTSESPFWEALVPYRQPILQTQWNPQKAKVRKEQNYRKAIQRWEELVPYRKS